MCNKLIILFLVCAFTAVGTSSAAELHDPTRPDNAIVAPIGEPVARFVVSAIFVSDNRRVAIVNGKTVTTGDRIGSATVRAIDTHSVKLHYRNKIIHTRLELAKVRE
ncbi:MAG: hypothetical protein HKN70_03415 [Gammaproteobacteria bacterium]|nr:hypothetical protein [Gammaproteobacteria bacterium]